MALGITGPEWMIILALADAETLTADISTISKMLEVDQSFVRAHARRLEKQGHIQCSARDEGILDLALTESAEKKLGGKSS
jgi:MarR family transcriptional regulator, organic hydroperoxide resistance regulator